MTIEEKNETGVKPYCVRMKLTYEANLFIDAHNQDDADDRAYGNFGPPPTWDGCRSWYFGGENWEIREEPFDFQIDFVDQVDREVLQIEEATE